ncbi:unnamed protein product, partial [Arabidopsis halleri]
KLLVGRISGLLPSFSSFELKGVYGLILLSILLHPSCLTALETLIYPTKLGPVRWVRLCV